MAAELQPLIDKVWRHCEDKGSSMGLKPVRLLGVSLSSLKGNASEEPQLGFPI